MVFPATFIVNQLLKSQAYVLCHTPVFSHLAVLMKFIGLNLIFMD